MEMARGTASTFGYVPNDLIEFIKSKSDFKFYKIDEVKCGLIPLKEFAASDPGANILCIPASAPERVQAVVTKYLK